MTSGSWSKSAQFLRLTELASANVGPADVMKLNRDPARHVCKRIQFLIEKLTTFTKDAVYVFNF